ncbi:MAG: PCMD domain-containing protein [Rikenellaceae bacterium]
MKRLLYILILIFSLGLYSCEDAELISSSGSEGEKGCLIMGVNFSDFSRSVTNDDILDKCVLRFYNSTGGLIRKYDPASSTPDYIYLVEGSYYAEIVYENDKVFTNDLDELYYYGKKEFTIKAGELTQIDIICSVYNSMLNVNFDSSVGENFDTEFMCYIAISDSFDKDAIDNNSVNYINFNQDTSTYVLLGENGGTISWGFYGTSSNVLIGDMGTYFSSGTQSIEPGSEYTLNFKFSKTPDGYLIPVINFISEGEYVNDGMAFSPQPTIKGSNFSISDTYALSDDNSSDIVYNVTALKEITTLVMEFNGVSYIPFSGGNSVDISSYGVSYNATSTDAGTLTISSSFLNSLNSGINELEFTITDIDSNVGEDSHKIAVNGAISPSDINLWNNTTTLNIVYNKAKETGAYLQYKLSSDSNWTTLTTTVTDDYLYSAKLAPEWEQSQNIAAVPTTIYSFKEGTGIFAGNTYQYRLMKDDSEIESSSFTTESGHTITDSDFEDEDLTCFDSENSSSSSWWASGNNSFAKSLCTQSTYTGMSGSCAKLAGASVSIVDIAAGNILLGIFYKDGLTTGVVEFGQAYSWSKRPKTFKFKYAASLGTVDAKYHTGAPLSKGDTDIAKIYFAIVDWSSRHTVSSGTGSPSGVWSPDSQSSTSEGNIIGYSCMYITSSQTTTTEVELPIYFYDTTTKPSKSYSIVISAATSAYGDYMTGSTSSKLYVDDFSFGY